MSSQPIRHFSEEPAGTPSQAEKPVLVAETPETFGGFRISRKLAESAFGAVYAAEAGIGSTVRQVALRVIGAKLLEGIGVASFVEHQKLLCRIEHPNIASVLDAGVTDHGDAWVATELIQGQNIDAYCLEKALPLANRMFLVAKLCKGIDAVHRALFLCGNIKPSNILVTAEGTPKLIDLVVVPRTAQRLRELNLDYASPEQIRGEPQTTATDVYLLGVLLHELSTGRPPFQLKGLPATEALRILSAVPLAKTLLPKDVDSIVRKAIAPDAGERYASAAEFAKDLDNFLNHQPLQETARKKGLLASGVNSNTGLFGAGAAGVLLIAAFALWTGYVAARDRLTAQRQFESLRMFADSTIADMPDAFASFPGATKLRTAFVKRTLEYLDRLSADPHDAAAEAELGRAYQKLARVQEDASALKPATPGELLAKARKHMDIAIAANPAQMDWACDLGWIHLQMAQASDVSAKERDEAAIAAERYWRKLRDQHPSEVKVHLGMASMLTELASREGSPANKRMYYTEALSFYESILENKPEDAAVIRDVARTHRALAGISDPSARLDHIRTAIEMDERLMKLDPRPRVDYGLDLTELSQAYQSAGESAEAAKAMDRVIAIRRKQSESDPSSGSSHAKLANSLNQAALLAFRQGDGDTARALYGEVIGRFSKSGAPQRAEVLAEAYSGLAQVDDNEGHTVIACSSAAIANENLANAKSMNPDQRKRIQVQIAAVTGRCR